MSRREKISAVDTAWLRMDRPGNLMMIAGVMHIAQPITLTRLRAVIAERFLRFPRFLMRPVQGGGNAFWEPADDFRLEDHVRPLALPKPGDDHALRTLMSRLAATGLPPERPLWQFDLIEHYQGGSAVVMRVHHCYADGMALVDVFLSMTDASPKVLPQEAAAAPARADEDADSEAEPLSRWGEMATTLAQAALRAGVALVEQSVALWLDPSRARMLAEQGGAFASEIARLALMGSDSATRLKGVPTGSKRAAWATSLSLHEVKAIGKALGGSVNDVLFSCLAGALRRYLIAQGDAVDGLVVRALVPVNLRPPGEPTDLGNQFGLVFLELPLGNENPIARLYAVRANMAALKHSYQPVLALGLLAAMGAGPKVVQDQLLEALARNASAVLTSVPGPADTRYLAGGRIESLMFWVPQSGDIGIGASIISYAGKVQIGLIADLALCPDPDTVVALFQHEFEQLVLATLLLPWPWDGGVEPETAIAAIDSLLAPAKARARARRRQGQAG